MNKIMLYNDDRVEIVKEGIFTSVVRFMDKWQDLPDRLPYWSNGAYMPGKQMIVVNSKLKEE